MSPSHHPRLRDLPGLAILLALPLAAACGGSSTRPPPPPLMSIEFTPRTGVAPANSITLRQGGVTPTTLRLDVVATSVTNVASVFFDIVFNPAVLRCSGAVVGPFLGQSGQSVTFVLPPDIAAACAAGRLPVGVTVTPATIGVSGTGAIGSIDFQSVASGGSRMVLERAGATLPLAIPIPDMVFEGGDVSVMR